jgi:hypothetical protein
VGLILFNDVGRVWVDDEDSDTLHHGYGGGLFITPFNFATITVLAAASKEGVSPLLKFGFFF